MSAPRMTPWGEADHVAQIAEGIWEVSTPSHGGIVVTARVHATMPQKYRGWVVRDLGPYAWFEEDCEWAKVALAFPDLFANHQEAARRTFERWCK